MIRNKNIEIIEDTITKGNVSSYLIHQDTQEKIYLKFTIIFKDSEEIIDISKLDCHDENRKNLINKFAPLVYLHSREQYFPSKIEWFLERTELRVRIINTGEETNFTFPKENGEVNVIAKKGDTEYILIKSPNSKELEMYDEKFNDTLRENSRLDFYFYLAPYNERRMEVRKGMNIETDKISYYANFIPRSDESIFIQFFFFYPFNGPFSLINIGYHEGDWEHVDVHIAKDGSEYKLCHLYYSYHGDKDTGECVYREEILTTEDGHPVVYSAIPGHACYPTTKPKYLNLYDQRDEGFKWKPYSYEGIVDVTSDSPSENNEWIKFIGSWGEMFSFGCCPRQPFACNYSLKKGKEYTNILEDKDFIDTETGRTERFRLANFRRIKKCGIYIIVCDNDYVKSPNTKFSMELLGRIRKISINEIACIPEILSETFPMHLPPCYIPLTMCILNDVSKYYKLRIISDSNAFQKIKIIFLGCEALEQFAPCFL